MHFWYHDVAGGRKNGSDTYHGDHRGCPVRARAERSLALCRHFSPCLSYATSGRGHHRHPGLLSGGSVIPASDIRLAFFIQNRLTFPGVGEIPTVCPWELCPGVSWLPVLSFPVARTAICGVWLEGSYRISYIFHSLPYVHESRRHQVVPARRYHYPFPVLGVIPVLYSLCVMRTQAAGTSWRPV